LKISVRSLVLTSLFTALTVVSAFVQIPFPLAPMTLQLLFVLMSGIILGPTLGALSQVIYIVLGLAGAPVFAYGGGFGYIFNPTFGFLIGFILMSFISGVIFNNKRSFKRAIAAGLIGLLSCYMIGLPYLYLIFNQYLGIKKTVWEVISGAMLIFIPGDILKVVIGSYLSIEILRRMRIQYDVNDQGRQG
jgi:biotin transport system substrate-specific component